MALSTIEGNENVLMSRDMGSIPAWIERICPVSTAFLQEGHFDPLDTLESEHSDVTQTLFASLENHPQSSALCTSRIESRSLTWLAQMYNFTSALKDVAHMRKWIHQSIEERLENSPLLAEIEGSKQAIDALRQTGNLVDVYRVLSDQLKLRSKTPLGNLRSISQPFYWFHAPNILHKINQLTCGVQRSIRIDALQEFGMPSKLLGIQYHTQQKTASNIYNVMFPQNTEERLKEIAGLEH